MQRAREELQPFEILQINQNEEDDIALIPVVNKNSSSEKKVRNSFQGNRIAAEQFILTKQMGEEGAPLASHNVALKAQVAASPDLFEDQHQYMDDDDDLVGTSPINLPDPSLFSDYHENDMENFEISLQGEACGKGGPLQQRQFLEEENEKRKLE